MSTSVTFPAETRTEVSRAFGIGKKLSPFQNAGAMQDGAAVTMKVTPKYEGRSVVLRDVVVPDSEVPDEFFINAITREAETLGVS